ncbi:MAG TPA: F0F1 ATP synthase subunit A [Terriglobia bacterium]|nr:F0F1 ATP synthase subunit A [Terriglobia bacterium]
MPEQHFWFAKLLNDLFGGLVATLMSKAGIPPANPHYPIPDYVGGEILVLLLIVVAAIFLRRKLSVENPGKLQHAMEIFLEFTQNLVDDMIGHGARRYVPLIGTLGLFIVVCNIIGLIPTFVTPTASVQVPVGCAVLVFIHYNFQGFRRHGVLGYLRHLCGPMMAIAIIMFPTEFISNFLRMLSLSVRLWANMLVGGILEGVFTGLIPIAIPAIFMALHIFESFLQAYVFMILPALYISLATAEEH